MDAEEGMRSEEKRARIRAHTLSPLDLHLQRDSFKIDMNTTLLPALALKKCSEALMWTFTRIPSSARHRPEIGSV